jgi:hypothetical protein
MKKTGTEDRMEVSIEVQTYNKMLPTLQRVANRKGLKEPSYKNSSRFQRKGSKLKSLRDIKPQATRRALCRNLSLLFKRNNYHDLVMLA